jgi:hypothetical protein
MWHALSRPIMTGSFFEGLDDGFSRQSQVPRGTAGQTFRMRNRFHAVPHTLRCT